MISCRRLLFLQPQRKSRGSLGSPPSSSSAESSGIAENYNTTMQRSARVQCNATALTCKPRRLPAPATYLLSDLLARRQMGWESADPYQYNPERGLYYHEVWPSLFCGTQPRSKADVDSLAGLLGPKGSILSLQQDKDLEYWGVSLHDIHTQAHQRNLNYLRRPVSILEFSAEANIFDDVLLSMKTDRQTVRAWLAIENPPPPPPRGPREDLDVDQGEI